MLDSYNSLHSDQEEMSVPVAWYPYQHLVMSAFLVAVISVGMWILICIFLMINDVEHLFMCLLVIYISSFLKSVWVFCPFFNFIFVSLPSCKNSLYIVDTIPLSYLYIYFAKFLAWLFISLMVSFEEQMFSIFMKFNLSVFFLWLVLLRSCLQNHYLLKGHEDILLYFLLVLIVLVLAFPLGLQSIFFLKEHLFIYLFWLHWVFVAAHGLSLVATSGGYSPLLCAGFSLWWLLLLRSMGSRRAAFSSCGTRAQ